MDYLGYSKYILPFTCVITILSNRLYTPFALGVIHAMISQSLLRRHAVG